MSAITHVLAGTDLSAISSDAVDRGFRIAQSTGARYTILYAVGIDAAISLRDMLGDEAEAVTARLLEDARQRLARQASDSANAGTVTADLRVARGPVAKEIPDCIRETGVDLVVVGAHGGGFLQRMLLGSTASRLIRESKVPVLVVKQRARHDYARVLVAVDFSPASASCVRLARELAPGAEMVLLHVFNVPFEGQMQYAGVSPDIIHEYRVKTREQLVRHMGEFAASAGLRRDDYIGLVVHGDAAPQVIEHETRYRSDLVVMGKHGTHVTEELLLGSVTRRVLAESTGDVLVVVDERRPNISDVSP